MTAAWVLHRIRREPRRHASIFVAVAAVFAVAALTGGAALTGARLGPAIAANVTQNVHVITYFDDDVDEVAAARVAEALRRLPGVERVNAVESDEALRRLRQAASSLGGAEPALTTLEAGFLPRSLEIALAPDHGLPARAADLAARLRVVPGVTQVDAMTEGLARLRSWMTLGRWILLAALAAFALAALAALALLAARGRARRRQQAEVLAFLGETPSAIRLPAAVATAAAAGLGTAAGLALFVAGFRHAARAFEAVMGMGVALSAAPPSLAFWAPRELALAVVAAVVTGGIVGYGSTPVPRTQAMGSS